MKSTGLLSLGAGATVGSMWRRWHGWTMPGSYVLREEGTVKTEKQIGLLVLALTCLVAIGCVSQEAARAPEEQLSEICDRIFGNAKALVYSLDKVDIDGAEEILISPTSGRLIRSINRCFVAYKEGKIGVKTRDDTRQWHKLMRNLRLHVRRVERRR